MLPATRACHAQSEVYCLALFHECRKIIQNIIDKPNNEIKKNLDLKILKEKKIINKKFKKLKILGTGEIKNNIEISAHFASKQALSKIEKVGGKISIIKK